jgi:hypothetical protein
MSYGIVLRKYKNVMITLSKEQENPIKISWCFQTEDKIVIYVSIRGHWGTRYQEMRPPFSMLNAKRFEIIYVLHHHYIMYSNVKTPQWRYVTTIHVTLRINTTK